MSAIKLLLFFVTSIGISLSLLYSFLLYRWDKRPPYSNQILAILLLFLSLRIGKSVFYNFVDLPLIIKNFGLAFNLAVGPLLLLYGQSLLKSNFKLKRRDILHFIPSFIYLLFSWIIPNAQGNPIWQLSYSLVLFQSFCYVYLSWKVWYTYSESKDFKSTWYLSLTLGLGSMWIVYLLIFINLIPVYLAGAFSFTLLVCILTYLIIKEKSRVEAVFLKKYKTSSLKKEDSLLIMKKIESVLSEEHLFLDPKLTLDHLAKKIGTHPKTISQVINENSGQNFARLINSHRIQYAQKLFSDPNTRDHKVIAIALESGFNSLSSFNAVFKQQVGMTPTQFRQKLSPPLNQKMGL